MMGGNMNTSLCIVLGLLCILGTATAMSSTNYDLSWDVIGGGGGSSSSTTYGLQGTIGQIPGVLNSANYRIESGFWVMGMGVLIPTKIGVFRNSTHTFYLDWNGNGVWNGAGTDRAFNFGLTGDEPVSGDWNTIGRSCIGVFRPATHKFYLDWNGNGVWDGTMTDKAYNFGLTGDEPVSGDWNTIGRSCIGVFRPSTHTFYLDWNGNGVWNGAGTDRAYNFGLTGDIPVSGDWNGIGRTCIGVFRPSTHTFYLDWNGNGRWDGGVTDRAYNFGLTGDQPVSGDWNNIGRTCIGVFRPSTRTFYLDWNGNGVWNGASTDRAFNFGLTGDKPVSGGWSS